MQKSFNMIGLAGIAAVAVTPAVVIAQDQSGTDTVPEPGQEAAAPAAPMPPEQEAIMQSWPADQQAAFKTWPVQTQSYYWSLNAKRQKMFWALSDGDKVMLSNMAEPQRETIWAQIESRFVPPRS